MASKCKKIFATLVFSVITFFVFAQLSYRRINSDDGLSQATNYSTCRDEKGYLWITSAEGLNRFDGKKVSNFFYNPLDSNSLYGNYVNSIFAFSEKLVFVSTSKGLCVYDYNKGMFTIIDVFNKKNIKEFDTYILGKKENILYLLDNVNGVYSINLINYALVENATLINTPKTEAGINSIAFNNDNQNLFYTTSDGFVKYNFGVKSEKVFKYSDDLFSKINCKTIWAIKLIEEDTLLLGTDVGLLYVDINTMQIFKQLKLPNKLKQQIKSIGIDFDKSIWLGSNNSCIYRVDGKKLNKVQVDNVEDSIESLKNIISFNFTEKCVFISKDAGVALLSRKKEAISKYNNVNFLKSTFSHPSVYCFTEAANKNIFIGGFNGGVYVFNPKTNDLSKNIMPNDLATLNIKSLLVENDNLFIGTKLGLYKRNTNNKYNLITPLSKNITKESNWINHIIKYGKNEIMVGTKNGIFRLDEKREHLIPMINENIYAYYLFINNKGQLLTTTNGINLAVYNLENKKLVQQSEYLKNFSILGIWQNPKNNTYWFSCNEGILYTDEQFKPIKFFNSDNGLHSDCFYNTIPDEFGNIWCASNRGIATISIDDLSIQYLLDPNELSSTEYNGKGFLTHSNGKIYFGGEGGMDAIQPFDILKRKNIQYNIELEDILINEIKIIGTQRENAINGTLNLNYDENQIAIKIGVVNIESEIKPQLFYRISELGENWIPFNSNDYLRLAKLPYGSYTLLIKLNNNDTVYKRLVFKIIPPYYEKWWFKALLIVLILGALYSIYLFRVKQLKKVNNVRQQISQDLHDELGSTLSSINMYSQIAKLKNDNLKILNKLELSTKSAQEKLDDIVWSTNPKNDTIEQVIDKINIFAIPFCKEASLEFKLEANEDIFGISMEEVTKQALYLIIKEAINNTVKYAKATMLIVTIKESNNKVTALIKDNGIGFNINLKTNRNGLLNMDMRSKQAKGICSINSEIGKGTSIFLQLPI